MTSYYPGDLTPITGNPDDIFLCDPIEEAASEYLQSEAKRRKGIDRLFLWHQLFKLL